MTVPQRYIPTPKFSVRASPKTIQAHPRAGKNMSEHLRLASPEQAELNKTERSIFDYYSVENEIRFVSETAHLPEEDIRFYINQNVLRFLGEFAGEIPYTKISLSLEQQGLEFAGIRTLPIYARAAAIAGDGSREQNEWIGYKQIEKALLDGKNGVSWISPPKDWNYGFVFHFEKDPGSKRVYEYIVRYSEQGGSVQASQDLLTALSPKLFFTNEAAFLHNPLTSDQSYLTFKAILTSLGVEEEDIQRSRRFEYILGMRLSSTIDEYIDAILQGDIEGAKKILGACFNYAKEFKKELDRLSLFSINRLATPSQHGDPAWIIAYYSTRGSLFVGGGSCPVTRAGNNSPFSNFTLYQNLKIGLPIETSILNQTCPECSKSSNTHFHCPGCGGLIESGKGIETCPHCDLNKDEFAKKTGVNCD